MHRNLFVIYFCIICTNCNEDYLLERSTDRHTEWPVFQSIQLLMQKDIVQNDWVILSSRNGQRRPRLIHKANQTYPIFEDDCQIPNLNLLYNELLGYIENGTFVEVGASGNTPLAHLSPTSSLHSMCLLHRMCTLHQTVVVGQTHSSWPTSGGLDTTSNQFRSMHRSVL